MTENDARAALAQARHELAEAEAVFDAFVHISKSGEPIVTHPAAELSNASDRVDAARAAENAARSAWLSETKHGS